MYLEIFKFVDIRIVIRVFRIRFLKGSNSVFPQGRMRIREWVWTPKIEFYVLLVNIFWVQYLSTKVMIKLLNTDTFY